MGVGRGGRILKISAKEGWLFS